MARPRTRWRSRAAYVLEQVVESGRATAVWRATDRRNGELVALKFFPPELIRTPGDFISVRDVIAPVRQLRHPNVIAAREVATDQNYSAVVSRWIEGRTLAATHASSPHGCLDVSQVEPWARSLVSLMESAHGRGVVHGALTPQVIFIRPDGSLAVTGFGINAWLRLALRSDYGPPHEDPRAAYASPAVRSGSHPELADDVYAFGAILYELITGVPPRGAGWLRKQRRALSMEKQRRTKRRNGEPVPVPWEAVVQACLEPDPFRRIVDFQEIRMRLGFPAPAPFAVAQAPLATTDTPGAADATDVEKHATDASENTHPPPDQPPPPVATMAGAVTPGTPTVTTEVNNTGSTAADAAAVARHPVPPPTSDASSSRHDASPAARAAGGPAADSGSAKVAAAATQDKQAAAPTKPLDSPSLSAPEHFTNTPPPIIAGHESAKTASAPNPAPAAEASVSAPIGRDDVVPPPPRHENRAGSTPVDHGPAVDTRSPFVPACHAGTAEPAPPSDHIERPDRRPSETDPAAQTVDRSGIDEVDPGSAPPPVAAELSEQETANVDETDGAGLADSEVPASAPIEDVPVRLAPSDTSARMEPLLPRRAPLRRTPDLPEQPRVLFPRGNYRDRERNAAITLLLRALVVFTILAAVGVGGTLGWRVYQARQEYVELWRDVELFPPDASSYQVSHFEERLAAAKARLTDDQWKTLLEAWRAQKATLPHADVSVSHAPVTLDQ